MSIREKSILDALMKHVTPEPYSGCWLWSGTWTTHGFGKFWDGTCQVPAHRALYEILRGPIRGQSQLGHLCKVRCCVNPDHLKLFSDEEMNLARFWSKVHKTDSCWEWMAGLTSGGYGQFMSQRAHRVSWEISHGPITEDAYVCHKCDNPICVNPSHLFLGTHLENMADRNLKGRQARGSKLRARISEDQIPRIREMLAQGIPKSEIGKIIGVSRSAICAIAFGKTWSHIQ